MSQQYRKRGQFDIYEPVPSSKGTSWISVALVVFSILAVLSQCSH